jgi:hypothetical protein
VEIILFSKCSRRDAFKNFYFQEKEEEEFTREFNAKFSLTEKIRKSSRYVCASEFVVLFNKIE